MRWHQPLSLEDRADKSTQTENTVRSKAWEPQRGRWAKPSGLVRQVPEIRVGGGLRKPRVHAPLSKACRSSNFWSPFWELMVTAMADPVEPPPDLRPLHHQAGRMRVALTKPVPSVYQDSRGWVHSKLFSTPASQFQAMEPCRSGTLGDSSVLNGWDYVCLGKTQQFPEENG